MEEGKEKLANKDSVSEHMNDDEETRADEMADDDISAKSDDDEDAEKLTEEQVFRRWFFSKEIHRNDRMSHINSY